MKRWVGRWIIGVGIVHVAVGFVVFGEPTSRCRISGGADHLPSVNKRRSSGVG